MFKYEKDGNYAYTVYKSEDNLRIAGRILFLSKKKYWYFYSSNYCFKQDELENVINKLKELNKDISISGNTITYFNLDMNDAEVIESIKKYYNTHYGVFKLGDNGMELHTGGWSDNEQIIDELSQTIFWMKYWQRSERGGHYYFNYKK